MLNKTADREGLAEHAINRRSHLRTWCISLAYEYLCILMSTASSTRSTNYRYLWLILLITLLLISAAYLWGPQLWSTMQGSLTPVWAIIQDRQALQAFVERLGWLGPIALILLNTLQIIIAPIPGYAVQVAAGFLYGPFWGGVWGSIGLLCGSMLAMRLARTYGRPLVRRVAGGERLARWENVSHSTSSFVWFILLLGPTGDLPYYLAGLAPVSFTKVALITCLIRVPSAFVTAAIGAGVLFLSWWQVTIVLAIVSGIFLAFARNQETFTRWLDERVQHRLDPDEVNTPEEG